VLRASDDAVDLPVNAHRAGDSACFVETATRQSVPHTYDPIGRYFINVYVT